MTKLTGDQEKPGWESAGSAGHSETQLAGVAAEEMMELTEVVEKPRREPCDGFAGSSVEFADDLANPSAG